MNLLLRLASRAACPARRIAMMLGISAALAVAGSANASDVTAYFFVKSRNFIQSGSDAPVMKTDLPFRVSAGAFSEIETDISAGSLVMPGGTVVPFPGGAFALEESFPTFGALNAAYPSGKYALRLQTRRDGTKTLTLNVPADAYPEAPRILNLAALQAIDAASDFQFEWAPFTGGAGDDFIQISILGLEEDEEWQTSPPWETGSLGGTMRAFTIPAGTLVAGKTYEMEIAFYNLTTRDTASYPGAFGLVGFGSQTTISIRTSGPSDNAPPFLVSSSPPDHATGVATNTAISFTFSEAMAPGFSVNWSDPINVANLDQSWSADMKTLTFVPREALKTNAVVTWTLNPSGAGFRDLSGNPLPAAFGQFRTETGSGDITPPTLVSVIPAFSSTPVSLEAPIVFQFDEPMQAGISITWSQNLFATNFTYAWSPDGKVLTCVHRIPLPENEEIRWTLNPARRPAEFRDVSFNALAQSTGSFTTVSLAPLTFITTALPSGRLNQSYSATLAASGGLPPYTWSLANFSERLHEGLTLTAAGEIVGVSSIAANKTPRFTVTDKTGKTVEKALLLDIKSHGTVEGPIQLRISTMSGERLRFEWNSVLGEAYQLQYKNQINDAVWIPVSGHFLGGPTSTFTVQTFPAGPRFYRLMVVN